MSKRPTENIDQAIVTALGRLVIQHAALEETLRICILRQSPGVNGLTVGVLLSGQSFSVLVEKFGAIYYEFHPKRRSDIQAICGRLAALNSRRNQFVHSFWTTGDGGASPSRLKSAANPQKGLVTTSIGEPPTVIEALVDELHAVQRDLEQLVSELRFPFTEEGTG